MKKAKSLTMAAVFTAALSVPAVAIAGPKFEELERAVPADVKDDAAIYDALRRALCSTPSCATEPEKAEIRKIQAECFGIKSPRLINGVLGPTTQACIHDHADGMALARAHAAEDQASIEAELASARDAGGKCDAAKGDCEKERDALKAKLALGGGSCDPDVKPVAAVEAYANAHCAGGSQVCWHSPTQFSCTNPRFEVMIGACAVDASGSSAICESQVKSAPGRGGVVPIPVPPPPPEPRGTCDGAGGKLLCYALPIAAVVIGGVLIGAAASDDFDLITVER